MPSLNSVGSLPYHYERCPESYPTVIGMMVYGGGAELRLGLHQTNIIRDLTWLTDANGKVVKGTAILTDAERVDLSGHGIEVEATEDGRWRAVQPVRIDHFYRMAPGRPAIGTAK